MPPSAECLVVAYIQFVRQLMVAEVHANDIAGGDSAAQAHKPVIAAVFSVVADAPEQIRAAVDGSCGSADHAVKPEPMIHKKSNTPAM